MKVNLFNHWFKYKVPIETHWPRIEQRVLQEYKPGHLWKWLNDKYDVGQYYKVSEGKNYLVFHNRNHYLMFLLKL
jgi:hypothetical protein